MPVRGEEVEKRAAIAGAQAILAVARTAPKSRGIDKLTTALMTETEEIEALAKAMETFKERPTFTRDADSVRRSTAIVLLGVNGSQSKGLNCGACGHPNCAEFDATAKSPGPTYRGPNCAFYMLDLGIALGAAARAAAGRGLDNRIMFSAGAAARTLGLIEADVAFGIPVSVTGKNPFFDRVWPKQTPA